MLQLEALGIGRPSTCVSTVGLLCERGSTVPYQRRFVPTERGRAVTAFLATWFARCAADGLTTEREEQRQLERQDHLRRGKAAYDRHGPALAFGVPHHSTIAAGSGIVILLWASHIQSN